MSFWRLTNIEVSSDLRWPIAIKIAFIQFLAHDIDCNWCSLQVVMAVAQLYHHCAPKSEVGLVIKALIRLLRGHK